MNVSEVRAALPFLSREERAELEALVAADPALWRPLPGPQSLAAQSLADITGYGGAAGGGKTDLACGLSLTEHRNTPQTDGLVISTVQEQLRRKLRLFLPIANTL